LPDYYKSMYCRKNQVVEQFEELIKNANFSTIFLSYNNEGLMSAKLIKEIMFKYGKYHLETKTYQRFKADKSENRNHKANETIEFLHCLKKNKLIYFLFLCQFLIFRSEEHTSELQSRFDLVCR